MSSTTADPAETVLQHTAAYVGLRLSPDVVRQVKQIALEEEMSASAVYRKLLRAALAERAKAERARR